MIFCIGNGESRKDFNLETLRNHGKIYGCNALYRDFTPDVLVAMDFNICHEIYRSGYAFKYPVYLKQWAKCPASMYSKFFYKETVDKFIGEVDNPNVYTNEWSWPDEKKRFFVCWANNKDTMEKLRAERKDWHEDDYKLHLSKDQEGYTITWTKKKDKVMGFGKYKNDKTNAGMLIAYMASDKDDIIYLIGYDYFSKTKTVNNLYKGTKGYVGEKAASINPHNWITHTKLLLNKFPNHKYIHVGEDKPFDELKDRKNMEWITYQQLHERLNSNQV